MILVIDDDIAIRTSLSLMLKKSGYSFFLASGPEKAVNWLRQNKPDLVLLDMNFTLNTSGKEGLEMIERIKFFHSEVPIILITAWASIELAVEGIKKGAFDFISKPWNNYNLLNTIESAIKLHPINTGKPQEKEKSLENYDFHNIITQNKEMKEILATIARISDTTASVLITGESGTGKELIAEAIHNNSKRKKNPFVKVNLGGVSTSLFESEMFGHKKGAFTDAHTDRDGRFKIAEKGTIFLDEIGELDLSCQVKLLRVLQEQTYEMLGDSKVYNADVRVICATNKNLPEMIEKGDFREDLFYRINLINIEFPPLRKRTDDIPVLLDYFIKNICEGQKINLPQIDESAILWLKTQAWPGNIREFKNIVERTILITQKEILYEVDFQKQFQKLPSNKIDLENAAGMLTLSEVEKQMIINTIKLYKGNISKVAKSLGLSRGALYRRLDKYNIPYES